MYTLLLGSFLIASYLFYHSSKRVKFAERPAWLKAISTDPKRLRQIAVALFLISLVVCCLLHGIGAGIFGWIIYMMGMLCLVILLDPYRYFRAMHIVGVFVFCGLLELLYTIFTPA